MLPVSSPRRWQRQDTSDPTLHRANQLTKSAYGSLAADGRFLEMQVARAPHPRQQENTILQNLALTPRAVSWKAGGRERVAAARSLRGHS